MGSTDTNCWFWGCNRGYTDTNCRFWGCNMGSTDTNCRFWGAIGVLLIPTVGSGGVI